MLTSVARGEAVVEERLLGSLHGNSERWPRLRGHPGPESVCLGLSEWGPHPLSLGGRALPLCYCHTDVSHLSVIEPTPPEKALKNGAFSSPVGAPLAPEASRGPPLGARPARNSPSGHGDAHVPQCTCMGDARAPRWVCMS